MEANFSLFWGLAIAAHEATLVSDDAPYDRFREGNPSALTPQQKFGLLVCMGQASASRPMARSRRRRSATRN